MEEVIANIRSALISTKGKCSLSQLQNDYKELIGQTIPFKKFGFSSLEAFLKTLPNIKVSKLPNGQTIVDAIATENVKHIVNLVNKQRETKKKVSYVSRKYKSPRRASREFQSKPKKDHKFTIPKPVVNKRRLSVFERLGPKYDTSEENVSTFDEDDDDEFVSKFSENRKITKSRKLPNIKITKCVENKPSTSKDVTWTDASMVLNAEEEALSAGVSRLSLRLRRPRITPRAPEDRLSMPVFPGGIVFNNNLPVTDNNITGFDRPRMRTQHLFPAPSGVTRPRMPFMSPVVRPSIPRFNQNILIRTERMPWANEDKKVIEVETNIDHRIQKPEENGLKISMNLEKIALGSDLEDEIIPFNYPKPCTSIKIPVSPIRRCWFPDLDDEANILGIKNIDTESTDSKILTYQDIPKINSFLHVTITYVKDPFWFYVQPFQTSAVLDSLMDRLLDKYKDNPTPCDIENVLPNDFYAFKHDDKWYRVQVANLISTKSVNVFFCDYGFELVVAIHELFVLYPEFFETPIQCVKSKISEIRPVHNTNWPQETIQYFIDRVFDKSFVTLVSHIRKGRELEFSLKIFDDDVNIGREMVDLAMAEVDYDV